MEINEIKQQLTLWTEPQKVRHYLGAVHFLDGFFLLVTNPALNTFQHDSFHQETQFTSRQQGTRAVYLRPFKGATFQLFLVKAKAITFKTQYLNLPG